MAKDGRTSAEPLNPHVFAAGATTGMVACSVFIPIALSHP